MAKFLSAFLVFVVATLLHWIFVEIFAPLNISVGVMAAFSLVMAARLGRVGGYTFAFFSGLFLDFFTNIMFGGYAFVFTAMLFIFYRIEDTIDFKEAGPQIVITAALNFAAVLFYVFMGKIFTGDFLWQGALSLIAGSVITGLLLPVLYAVVAKYLIFGTVKKNNESKTVF